MSTGPNVTDTIYVANLPYNMTDDDVRYELGSFGTIKDVKMGEPKIHFRRQVLMICSGEPKRRTAGLRTRYI